MYNCCKDGPPFKVSDLSFKSAFFRALNMDLQSRYIKSAQTNSYQLLLIVMGKLYFSGAKCITHSTVVENLSKIL